MADINNNNKTALLYAKEKLILGLTKKLESRKRIRGGCFEGKKREKVEETNFLKTRREKYGQQSPVA